MCLVKWAYRDRLAHLEPKALQVPKAISGMWDLLVFEVTPASQVLLVQMVQLGCQVHQEALVPLVSQVHLEALERRVRQVLRVIQAIQEPLDLVVLLASPVQKVLREIKVLSDNKDFKVLPAALELQD